MTDKDNGNGITNKVQLAVIANDIQYIKAEMREIKTSVQSSYVTKEEFSPVKKIVYGLVGIMLLGIGGGLLKLVIR